MIFYNFGMPESIPIKKYIPYLQFCHYNLPFYFSLSLYYPLSFITIKQPTQITQSHPLLLFPMNNRNYMQQYNRTKSTNNPVKAKYTYPSQTNIQTHVNSNIQRYAGIGSHNSYKNLLQSQECKSRENSGSHLKLSKMSIVSMTSLSGQKMENNNNQRSNMVSIEKDHKDQGIRDERCQWADQTFGESLNKNNSNFITKDPKESYPLTLSAHNITNISYGKLNSQMKMKINAKQEKGKTNITMEKEKEQIQTYSYKKSKNQNINSKELINNMGNIGVGLRNQKKKTKFVTVTTANTTNSKSYKAKSSSKSKNLLDSMSISRSISKSHKNSTINSKYSTNMRNLQLEQYRSVKKQVNKSVFTTDHNMGCKSSQKIQVVTLNSSMFFAKDDQEELQVQVGNLEAIYERVKNVLKDTREKEKKWQQQKNRYENKIRELQDQIQRINKRNINKFPKYIQNYEIEAFIDDQISCQKSSNRNKYLNHR